MAERFVTFDITEVEEFIDNEENSNTRRKTKNNMALMSSFMAKEKENRQFERDTSTRTRQLFEQIPTLIQLLLGQAASFNTYTYNFHLDCSCKW